MRTIISVPYSFVTYTRHIKFNLEKLGWKLPYREKLYSPDLEQVWVDVSIDKEGLSLEETKEKVLSKCREISPKHPYKLVINGDHSFTYSFLRDEVVENVIVVDEHDDGIIQDPIKGERKDIVCHNWGYMLRKLRPELNYILVRLGSLFRDYGKVYRKFLGNEQSYPETEEALINFDLLKGAIEKNISGKRTAISFCADCSNDLHSPIGLRNEMLTTDQILKLVRFLDEKTDLVYIDIAEANLFEEIAADALRTIIEDVIKQK